MCSCPPGPKSPWSLLPPVDTWGTRPALEGPRPPSSHMARELCPAPPPAVSYLEDLSLPGPGTALGGPEQEPPGACRAGLPGQNLPTHTRARLGGDREAAGDGPLFLNPPPPPLLVSHLQGHHLCSVLATASLAESTAEAPRPCPL